jgi:hypothetical protein
LSKSGGLSVLLLVVALLFPGLLIGLLLFMEHVERRLGKGLLTDQVAWMLGSELPAEQVESQIAERLGAPVAGVSNGRHG